MVSAILLAAGEAKRMGKPKLLMPFGDGTVLGRTLDILLSSRVDEVIVVLGAEAEEMRKVVADKGVKVVINPDYRRGMSTSLIAGLKQVDSRAQRVMVALADQPLIGKETYNRLIEESLRADKGIIVLSYQGKRGNPVIFSVRYREELLWLGGDVGGRDILKKYPDDILEVAVDSESVSTSINTLDDYNSLLKLPQ